MIDQDIYDIVDLEGDWDTPIEPEDICPECGEPLADGEEVTCQICGNTYVRDKKISS
jgi:formylmethanofuran dehydrogenase subunit E